MSQSQSRGSAGVTVTNFVTWRFDWGFCSHGLRNEDAPRGDVVAVSFFYQVAPVTKEHGVIISATLE